MNKKSKLLFERNMCIQEKFAKELAKTSSQVNGKKKTIVSIYAALAVEYDLSIERVREIVCRRRI